MAGVDWGRRLETRIKELEEQLEDLPKKSKEDEELDKMIRDAFRGWLLFGRFVKFVVLGLAALGAAVTAWKTVVGGLGPWFGK